MKFGMNMLLTWILYFDTVCKQAGSEEGRLSSQATPLRSWEQMRSFIVIEGVHCTNVPCTKRIFTLWLTMRLLHNEFRSKRSFQTCLVVVENVYSPVLVSFFDD